LKVLNKMEDFLIGYPKLQHEGLAKIYTLVLKYGWNIKLKKVYPEGTHIFNLVANNPRASRALMHERVALYIDIHRTSNA